MKQDKPPDKLICQSCRKEFSCGASLGHCWCFEIELGEETLAKLREKFKNCLCEDCLVTLATNNTNKTNIN